MDEQTQASIFIGNQFLMLFSQPSIANRRVFASSNVSEGQHSATQHAHGAK